MPHDSLAERVRRTTTQPVRSIKGQRTALFAKIEVNGAGTHPLFQWLKAERPGLLGGAIKWNFTKFLIGRDGQVLDRFAPTTTPDHIEPDVEAALKA